MSKRFKILLYVVLPLIMILILTPAVITFFFFPQYRLTDEGIMCLLSSVVQFYAGFKQIQVAKKMEKPILWWKSYSIILGLWWGCFGVLLLVLNLAQVNHQVNNVLASGIGTFFGILFAIFIIGLFIYGFILLWQQTITKKGSN